MTTSPCRGLLGILFGHLLVKAKGGYVYTSNYCYRCGMPRGGWA